MQEESFGLFDATGRSHWIRLRTLIVLRWVAIAGQIMAIAVGAQVYGLQLELGLCYLAIGTAVAANIIAILVFPENRRLSDTEALLTLLFDMGQLAFLIYLTGGLNNPFALLILTPVTIAATALTLQSVLILGSVTIGMITVISFYFFPLRFSDGTILAMPDVFVFGFWVAIVIGVSFLALYARRVSVEIHAMSNALLATRMALAREQKLTDLGGVVAAAAHELGTPLATIKLASAELREELESLPNLPEHLVEDADLIKDQAERCREILRSMGRAGKDDLHLRTAPLEAVIEEAAEPHRDRGKEIRVSFEGEGENHSLQPTIFRRPEIIHGLRNLVQNAVDFAATEVCIEATWNSETVTVRIIDDGQGFPAQLFGRIGDPFVGTRRASTVRKEYEGMGLGLFIAKTLLERAGAELVFANGPETAKKVRQIGAVVEVSWQREILEPSSLDAKKALGPNALIAS